VSNHNDQEAYALAGAIVSFKTQYDQAQAAGNQSGMEQAAQGAAQVRDRLHSLGYGWIAQKLSADGANLAAAQAAMSGIMATLRSDGVWSTGAGSPQQQGPTTTGTTAPPVAAPASGGAPGGTTVSVPVNPAPGQAPAGTPQTGGFIGSVVGSVQHVIGGVGGSAADLLQRVAKIVLPLLLIFMVIKVFRVGLKLGGSK
jgi:hypothetical protein